MADDQTSGWFRHRQSGQVFEADGYQFREACKNKDLERVDPPDEVTADAPDESLIRLRERLTTLGQEWHQDDTEDVLNERLTAHTVRLRAELDQQGIRHMPNWRPETLATKLAEAKAAKTQAPTG